MIASIYLDGGLEEARKFVLRFIPKHLNVKQVEVNFDYKTALQEFVQRNKQETLDYQTVEERGPDPQQDLCGGGAPKLQRHRHRGRTQQKAGGTAGRQGSAKAHGL